MKTPLAASRSPSISTRLFLGFVTLLVTALVILGLLSTFWFSLKESERMNLFLLSEAQALSNRLEGLADGWVYGGNPLIPRLAPSLRKDLAHFFEQRRHWPAPFQATFLILGDRGEVLGESDRALDLSSRIPDITPGTVLLEDIKDRGPAYRVLTSRIDLGPGTLGTIRIGCLLANLDQSLWNFLASLFIILGGSLVLLTALGGWLVMDILRPVRSMASAAGHISEHNLSGRIPVPPGTDSLAGLAGTLNSLLARLETGFTFQKQLVGDLTHELKTPITILRGRNEISLTSRNSVEAYRELVYENLDALDSMGTLLNALLELARFDSRVDKLSLGPVDLGWTLEALVGELGPLWQAKNLQVRLGGPPIRLLADPLGLRQVLMNLLDNSWKYAPEGSELRIYWDLQETQALVTLTNQGPPVPENDLEKIFDRFYRSTPPSEAAPGSGLGLAIVRSLVTLHGGTIRAYNPPEGGVAFEILWPIVREK